jgi:hypothetical protein
VDTPWVVVRNWNPCPGVLKLTNKLEMEVKLKNKHKCFTKQKLVGFSLSVFLQLNFTFGYLFLDTIYAALNKLFLVCIVITWTIFSLSQQASLCISQLTLVIVCSFL